MIAISVSGEIDLGSQRLELASPSIVAASTSYGAPARVTLQLPEEGGTLNSDLASVSGRADAVRPCPQAPPSPAFAVSPRGDIRHPSGHPTAPRRLPLTRPSSVRRPPRLLLPAPLPPPPPLRSSWTCRLPAWAPCCARCAAARRWRGRSGWCRRRPLPHGAFRCGAASGGASPIRPPITAAPPLRRGGGTHRLGPRLETAGPCMLDAPAHIQPPHPGRLADEPVPAPAGPAPPPAPLSARQVIVPDRLRAAAATWLPERLQQRLVERGCRVHFAVRGWRGPGEAGGARLEGPGGGGRWAGGGGVDGVC
jgi:hypothetical protein